MAKQSRLTIAKNDIFAFFEKAPRKVFTHAQIAEVLDEQRSFWRLAVRTSTLEFVSFLIDQKRLKRVELRSEEYDKKVIRYTWGEASPYPLALSLRASSYLSHGTAVFLHGLTDLIPKTTYLNVEQSPKPPPRGELTQSAIDRAFSNKQRQSNLSYTYSDWSVTVISGKNTGRLGVEGVNGPSGEDLEVTNLERTLIDIVVRPAYAGGVFHVLQAYRSAKEQMSTNRLVSILKKLDYTYPYHQAIGFLMQRAGYERERYDMLHELGLRFQFHLAHGIVDPQYDNHWKLFHPAGLES
jgi:predicted transcriptional regulator of viral defense system